MRVGTGERARHRVGRSLLLAAVLALSLAACGTPKLTGTDLGGQPAPGFTLTDQRGQTVSLQQLQGRAVALTFIYTNCPDVCPLIAEHYRAAYDQLPADVRSRVALLAVTVDPERDNRAALQAFSAKHGLQDNPQWHALTGDRAALEQVWHAYAIDPGSELGATPGATPNPETTLDHTAAIYIIDRDGKERALLGSDAAPADIAADLKALAG